MDRSPRRTPARLSRDRRTPAARPREPLSWPARRGRTARGGGRRRRSGWRAGTRSRRRPRTGGGPRRRWPTAGCPASCGTPSPVRRKEGAREEAASRTALFYRNEKGGRVMNRCFVTNSAFSGLPVGPDRMAWQFGKELLQLALAVTGGCSRCLVGVLDVPRKNSANPTQALNPEQSPEAGAAPMPTRRPSPGGLAATARDREPARSLALDHSDAAPAPGPGAPPRSGTAQIRAQPLRGHTR
jgi:hypothetical protein